MLVQSLTVVRHDRAIPGRGQDTDSKVGPNRSGCIWDGTRKGLGVELYANSSCELQLCSCLERRRTSLVWDVAVKCGTTPQPGTTLQPGTALQSVNMILSFRRQADETGGGRFLNETDSESFFAKTMKSLVARKPESNIKERIGFKLGTVEVPIKMLHSSAMSDPGQCNDDWIFNGALYARGLEHSRLLLSPGSAIGSVEFRTFLPVVDLYKMSKKNQLVVPVLRSMVEDFQDYRSANVTHCDRGKGHITLGRAPSRGGAPVAQIIDTDRVQQGFDVQLMAHWFGATTYNVAKMDGSGKRMAYYSDGWSSACRASFNHISTGKAAYFLQEQLAEAERGADLHGTCKGMRELVNRVVRPALQVAMGIGEAPEDWWAGEVDEWAAKFYPSNSAANVDWNDLFVEAELKDQRTRGE